MRIALVVGVDYYETIEGLHGCANDANAVSSVLSRHADGSVNFDVERLTAVSSTTRVTRAQLKDSIAKLFATQAEIALFYFAGHGYIENTGGYVLASDASRGDEGISLFEILTMANTSKAQNAVLVLDSCHSGVAGDLPSIESHAFLKEGVTVLTASTAEQYASEDNGHGVFTELFVDALAGGAANLTGDISPGSIYAHIDQSLGAWDQRPVFKTNVKQFVSLRKVAPPIPTNELRRIAEFFPYPGYEFKLDPSFEPEEKGRDSGMAPPDPENVKVFGILQKYNRLNLLVPVGAPHMWHATMQSKTCKLTALGEHYRRLAEKGRI